ncbi:MAG: aminotransferase class V-fold PLP-dependent enzyme [Nitrospira sp.]|nr:aminotransferase class V-fold PLP-dependent enzyme [Nitrospira sp.]
MLESMLPYFIEKFGKRREPEPCIRMGRYEEGVETARKQIAKLILHADAKEIVFTSGATESNNLALKGVVERAVLDTAKTLEAKRGVKGIPLPVDKFGMVSPEDVRNAITDKTILISVMFANNEIGTINPIKEIGKIAKEKAASSSTAMRRRVVSRSTCRTWVST